ncbi:MAG: hypothetical protein KAX80_04520 [Planctomycetes bacterium]|nr:hypothetical protein [Planctomycetota bacterium]
MKTGSEHGAHPPEESGQERSCCRCTHAARCLWLPVLLFVGVCGFAVLQVVAARGPGDEPPPPVEGRPRVVRLKGIRYDLEAGRVIMEGRIALGAGVVELFACVRGTKDYESVVAVDCQPYDLHLGLLALGLKAGRPVGRQEGGELPVGPPVVVWVEWKDTQGRTVRHRAEELILNVKTKKPMEPAGWAFVGSRFIQADPQGKEVYAAALTGAVITTYHDPTTVLDNPRPTGGDDTLFVVNTSVVPPVGTPVRVIVEPEKKSDVPAKT